MRTILAMATVALSLAGPVAAQDWYVQGSPEADAIACLPGEFDQIATSLCLYVGCQAGGAPRLGLSLQQVPLPAETPVRISVDGRGVADLVLTVPPGDPGGAIPLEGRESLLDALRTGRGARVSLGTVEGWRDYEVQLLGAREAIDSALASCPSLASQDGPGQEPAGRTSDDPAAEAIAENEAFCAGGTTTVEPGFVQQADVDGDGVNDVLINYMGLTCDGTWGFCGTGGCNREIWLGDPAGPYRLLLSDLIQQIELPEPGRLRVVMDGGACGLSGAEICEYDYRVEEGVLHRLD